MLTKNEILTFLRNEKDKLFSNYKLVKIGLFGSYARNEFTENSDVDIIVEFESNTKNLSEKKLALKNFLSEKFNKDVDLCREKYIRPYFKDYILNSAIYV